MAVTPVSRTAALSAPETKNNPPTSKVVEKDVSWALLVSSGPFCPAPDTGTGVSAETAE